ncbi:MAG: DNA/RNA nuclease SfsA [Thermoproteus sp.]|nr:DNA/RNA nuclease SfsA [Thermoproteus sp.]
MPKPGDVVYVFDGPLTPVEIIRRPNRFLVEVSETGRGRAKVCHIHDPGRLPELVRPGARALVRPTKGAKTDCSITAIEAPNGVWVVADSRIHGYVASSFFPGAEREVRIGRRRIDLRIGDEYIEVKGCTLVVDGEALFPDAPTRRGADHMRVLKSLIEDGYRARVVVLVMRPDARCFRPNWATDPIFSRAFVELVDVGAAVDVLKFRFEGGAVVFDGRLDLCAGWRD